MVSTYPPSRHRQLSLPGFETALLTPPFGPEVRDSRDDSDRRRNGPLWYTLLFAMFPQPADAQRISKVIAGLRAQHRLEGTPLLPERLHITLHALATFAVDTAVPRAGIAAAVAAAATVACPRLHIVFDHALSFPASQAFVLRCDAGSDAGVARLRGTLALALRRCGHRPKPSGTPHMTMLYDARHVTKQAITPVCWTATRFALILSHVGIGHHQPIGEWALGETAPPSSQMSHPTGSY